MKKILITGKNSYIGTSFEKWLAKEPENYQVDTVDTRDGIWAEKDFSPYDAVFHVAGIAHVSADPKMKDLYYKVNRDLTIAIAKKAKAEGVKQFIFMSSIIVYGGSEITDGIITKATVPKAINFYGDSKIQAELKLKNLEDSSFKIVVIRPPMIYGKGAKGNYPKLAKMALKLPFFLDYPNKRSMIYVNNLSEFIKLLIINEEKGIFYPQNEVYVQTSHLVRKISEVHGKKNYQTTAFNRLINLMMPINIVSKVFGSLAYDKTMSIYEKGRYNIYDFDQSIKEAEM